MGPATPSSAWAAVGVLPQRDLPAARFIPAGPGGAGQGSAGGREATLAGAARSDCSWACREEVTGLALPDLRSGAGGRGGAFAAPATPQQHRGVDVSLPLYPAATAPSVGVRADVGVDATRTRSRGH